jgi:hypothetical protein
MAETVRLGLYFVPEAESDLYKVGSSIIGYDVHEQRELPGYEWIDPAWIGGAAEFGLHTTVTDAVTYTTENLDRVAAEAERLLGCLNADDSYNLHVQDAVFWNNELLVVELGCSQPLLILHTLLVSRLHPLGIGSAYTTSQPPILTAPADKEKLRYFHAPYIFDRFRPHFTLLTAFSGDESQRVQLLENVRSQMLTDRAPLQVRKLALVLQLPGEAHFHVYRELTVGR